MKDDNLYVCTYCHKKVAKSLKATKVCKTVIVAGSCCFKMENK